VPAADAHVRAVGMAVRPGTDLDGLAIENSSPAVDHGDAVLAHQGGDAAGEAGYEAVLPAHRLRQVDGWRLNGDADRGAWRRCAAFRRLRIAGDPVELLRRVDQCLRWNAADVQAGAAEPLALDQRDLHTELCSADSRDI